MTAAMGVAAHAAATPDKPALVCGERRVTYGELDDRAARVAGALRGLGVQPGDRVAVMLPNSVEFFEVTQAAPRVQATTIPVNWHLKGEELGWILADSGARALVAHRDLAEPVAAALDAVPGCRLLTVGAEGGAGYEAAVAAADPLGAAGTPGGPSLMFYTSGTTGRPKGTEYAGSVDPRFLMAQVALFGLRPDDVHLMAGPAYHAAPGGWAGFYLMLGATVVLLERWDARAWLGAVDAHRVTTAFVVPSHFIRLFELGDDEWRRHDLSTLRLLMHAGEPCPVPVKRTAIERFAGVAVWEYYGGSEAGTATCISGEEWLAHPGSVGRPLEGIEVRILDAEGRPQPPGVDGLVYSTPWGPVRYHDDPDKTAAAWRGELFTLGDIGHLDADGYLYLTDRRDDLILRGGVNVYPREVEIVLHQHPAVVDCAVHGVPDDRLGEIVRAVVEVRDEVTADELRAHCRARLADFKCPAIVDFVDRLPRDPNGKIRRRALRDAGPGRGVPGPPAAG